MSRHLVAAAYVTAGWSVVPVIPGDKKAAVEWKDYQARRATIDEIREWWRERPDANIAIITGMISDLTVIDIDVGHGGLDSLKQSGYQFPRTRVHQTPNGYHLLFRHTPALHTAANFLSGIDCRNDGGYVVAPPSVRPDGTYTVLRDEPLAYLADPPPWLVTRKEREPKPRTAQGDPEWVAEAMRGVGESQRNATATKLIGYFHGRGTPYIGIEAIMREFGRACSPPMDERELQQTIRSVTRYPVKANQGFGFVPGLWDARA